LFGSVMVLQAVENNTAAVSSLVYMMCAWCLSLPEMVTALEPDVLQLLGADAARERRGLNNAGSDC